MSFYGAVLVTKSPTTEGSIFGIEKNCQDPPRSKSLFYMPFTEAEMLWRSSEDQNSVCSAEKWAPIQ